MRGNNKGVQSAALEFSRRFGDARLPGENEQHRVHLDDINKLLAAFRALIEAGGSLLVIEHNLDVIKTADYVIDLGPEGGDKGGHVVTTGTPEQIMKSRTSHTGKYLRSHLVHANGKVKRSGLHTE